MLPTRLSLTLLLFVLTEWMTAPAVARAQSVLAGCKASQAMSKFSSATDGGNHIVLDGTVDDPVQIDCDEMQLQANHLEYFRNEGRVIASGTVVFVSGGSHISAERMEFNTKTRTGTFYVASGSTVLREKADPGLFGSQEPDLMFYGDEIHKLGPKKYRIVRGGFTTCIQPTPRWEMTSGSITLTLEEYALLRNAFLKVKNVPLMYLPVFYYPIQEDDRATGFLMPIYGNSTVKGHSISTPFFWAINRSHDATLYYDWYSMAGQQFGGDYDYVLGPGSQGSARTSLMNQPASTTTSSTGGTTTQDAVRSYTVSGNMTQRLPANLQVRGSADYFSSIRTQQLFQQDIYQATSRQRRFGANLGGNWGPYVLSVTADKSDFFTGDTSFTTTGSLPRVSFSRGERPIMGSTVYFGAGSEFVTLQRSTTTNDVKASDQGLTRFDVNPTVRIPFTRWPFLTINSAVSWRATYWSESYDPDQLPTQVQVEQSIGRSYVDLSSRITGPVFNRIFNTPGNGYAEKFKHVIEPTIGIQRTTAIDIRDRIVALEGSDYVVGGTTRVTYGLSNRLYAKKTTSREILSATIAQSYYSNSQAAQYDRQYQSTTYTETNKPTNFSAVALLVRSAPADLVQGDFRTEWDPTTHALKTLAANGSLTAGLVQATAGWSQRKYIPGLPGYDVPSSASHYLNAATTVRSASGRLGGNYMFNYDLRQDSFLQQRILAYYNAQCCGIAVEYQMFNLQGGYSGATVPQDRRFNLSFTLAGVGTFSNLFGAFGGNQGR